MKVLHYTHAFAPTIANYVMLLAEGLSKRQTAPGETRVEVTVVTPTPRGDFDDAQLPFRVVREPDVATLWRLLKDTDVVQLAGPCLLPMALALLQRRPVVVEHHGYQAACLNGMLLHEPDKVVCPGHFLGRRYHRCLRCHAAAEGWATGLKQLLLTFPRRWLSRQVQANTCITRHVAERLQLPRSNVIYYGVPDMHSGASHLNGHLALLASPCFAYVGRLVTEKGLPLLLMASRRLAGERFQFKVKLIGDGPERAHLETMVQELGLADRVSFTGSLTGDSFAAALRDVDVVVMPSICEETAGLSAIEQMMRGRVVIASDIGGLGEVVNGAGLKFPPGDAEALANCMQRILMETGLALELGRRARERATQMFRHERMIEEHVALYQKLCKGEDLAPAQGGV